MVEYDLDALCMLTEAAARFFVTEVDGSWVPGYLTDRGFGPEIWRPWSIGYAPAGWTALTDHLRGLGFSAPVIEAAGLARRSARGSLIDVFRDRVMFPVRAADGSVTGFIGRAPPGARTGPVYLNSPTTQLYHKGSVLFGLPEARSALAEGARLVIAEGPLDAIAITTAGGSAPGSRPRYAGLASCGTALTPAQVTLLTRFSQPLPGPVVACSAPPSSFIDPSVGTGFPSSGSRSLTPLPSASASSSVPHPSSRPVAPSSSLPSTPLSPRGPASPHVVPNPPLASSSSSGPGSRPEPASPDIPHPSSRPAPPDVPHPLPGPASSGVPGSLPGPVPSSVPIAQSSPLEHVDGANDAPYPPPAGAIGTPPASPPPFLDPLVPMTRGAAVPIAQSSPLEDLLERVDCAIDTLSPTSGGRERQRAAERSEALGPRPGGMASPRQGVWGMASPSQEQRPRGGVPRGRYCAIDPLAIGRRTALVGPRGVIVAFDGDEAGRRAAVRAFDLFRDADGEVSAALFPAGADPAGYFRDRGAAALASLLDEAVPLADLVVDARVAEFDRWLEFTDGRFAALRATAPLVAGLPIGQVARQVARVAHRLDLSYAEVTEAVTTALADLVHRLA